MPLRGFAIRGIVLVLPGILLLAGGPSPAQQFPQEIRTTADYVFQQLYPDTWMMLMICSFLVCLPGLLFVVWADYLAEVTFARVPLNTTPAVIWRVLGYIVALVAGAFALARMVEQ